MCVCGGVNQRGNMVLIQTHLSISACGFSVLSNTHKFPSINELTHLCPTLMFSSNIKFGILGIFLYIFVNFGIISMSTSVLFRLGVKVFARNAGIFNSNS